MDELSIQDDLWYMKQRSIISINAFQYNSLIAAIFIFLFVYTAVNKLLGFSAFVLVLQSSPLIGNFADIIAWLLPGSELFVAGLLFFPKTRRAGLYSSLLLMGMFTGYLTFMMAVSPELPCSCGGVLKHLSWIQHLYLNIFLIVLVITALSASAINKFFIAISRRSRKPVIE